MQKEIKNKKKLSKRQFIKVLVFLAVVSIVFIYFSFSFKFVHAESVNDTANRIDSATTGILQTGVGIVFGPLFLAFNGLLYVVFGFAGLFLVIAGILFDWAINPDSFMAVMKMKSIYQAWTIVRDFLNLSFIIVLLFSAFCTIFQVEKYNFKKILLTLIIMALLVNFSFPISRFIVDTANVAMYYIIGQGLPWVSNESGLSTSIVQFSGVVFSMLPGGGDCGDDWAGKIWCKIKGVATNLTSPQQVTMQLLGAIIFLFLLSFTLFVIALLLIIRIVVLAILIIFSPLGFVASIFPGTKNYADMWWGNLFKQAFFGPIMAFMLYISITIMKEVQDNDVGGMSNFISHNLNNENNYSSIIVAGATMAIPIVLLWTGIIAAQKLGAAGAGTALNGVRRLAKTNFARRHGGTLIRRAGDVTNRTIGNTIGRIPGVGRVYRGIADRTAGRMGDYGARMETQAEVERIKRGRTREDMRDSIVREHLKNIDHINTADELGNGLERARSSEEREAYVRRAMTLGSTSDILNRGYRGNRYSNDEEGLRQFMINAFGDNEQSARLASTIAVAESQKNNSQFMGVASYNPATNRYEFSPPAIARTAAQQQAINNAVFAAAGGDHPQNAVRNKFTADFTVTMNPAAATAVNPQGHQFSQTFENFLQNLGNDFNSRVLTQLNEIPSNTIRRMQQALNNGVIPAAGSRTETLINTLRAPGPNQRLT